MGEMWAVFLWVSSLRGPGNFAITVFYIDGLEQERRNSSALAMELRLSCNYPLICDNML